MARGEGDRSLTVRLQQRPSTPVHATMAAVRPSGEPHTTVLVVLQPGDLHAPGAPGPSESATAQVPDLGESTRHAALMDLLDEMTTTLLTTPRGDREAVLQRAAQVLHGSFADWVIADTGTTELSRTTVPARRKRRRRLWRPRPPWRAPWS
ncbi:hypothetical protein [Streptomyces regalis]|uniref:hypothetical protein n=1 Tax=Streptomyces regalis TaxID=68262 RepID=UPI000AEAC846|nr:hypothetical protein [Streptomyces regalis]